jgi:hypothetical protein
MRLFAVCVGGKHMVATKGNKRKSRNFYYRLVGYRGVEFTKRAEYAHTCPSKQEAEFLIKYLQKRIEEVGFILLDLY